MCGMVGYWDRERKANINTIQMMSKKLQHRGPDGSGVWLNSSSTLALAHRRLSIIDLTEAGHQPMLSSCGKFVLVFNGEIYNHLELRRDLENENVGITWHGHSDTETLLISLQFWGVEKTLKKLNGMFAFALWNDSEQKLFLARDRMGEKPLYYGNNNNCFFFGSELKSFKPHPGWKGEVDRNALALFMRYSVVPSPWSIYQGISKLPPAHFVIISDNGTSISKPRCYWNLSNIAEENSGSARGGVKDLTDELDTLLNNAVSSRMASDVPLGAFLSGGLDSTIVAALMQKHSSKPIKTFTIGFNERGYNEATHAKDVAQYLGTDHTELYVGPKEAMNVISNIGSIWDEPFADSSQIPTLLVSQLAKQHVTVSLSGDGGDELFCGYNRYTKGYQIWERLKVLPLPIRRVIARLIDIFPTAPLEYLIHFLPMKYQVPHLTNGLSKLADVMRQESDLQYYQSLVSHWKNPQKVVLNSVEPKTLFNNPDKLPNLDDFREQMMFIDSVSYLPDDILTKVDRASMFVSLEARVPLLDHRIVEFAQKIPISLKYQNGEGKWLLREVLNRYVPKKLMDRPKMGFGIPIDEWLKKDLREWAEELLSEKRLREEGFFDYKVIRKMWNDYVNGKLQSHYYLWDVLMFQAWLDEQ
jgi:asparagine synthase (glutamine-hydrolysing)